MLSLGRQILLVLPCVIIMGAEKKGDLIRNSRHAVGHPDAHVSLVHPPRDRVKGCDMSKQYPLDRQMDFEPQQEVISSLEHG